MMRRKLWFCSAALLLLVGCGKEATPPPEAPPVAEQPAPPPPPSEKPGDDPAQSDINVDETIRKACGLTETEAHFAYNSASVRESDKQTLKKIADCFMTGPLKGRNLLIVGHADPRGEPEYNLVLGGRRSENVAKALNGVGLAEAQMVSSSRGEMDATGTDEASWAKDRRVDLLLDSGD